LLWSSPVSSSTSTSSSSSSSSLALSSSPLSSDLLDPNPDIRALFLFYNAKYFQGKLDSVEVKWSSRMKLCAGLCRFQRKAGFCSVTLSEPLLKFRSRKEVTETLLHEMIHAFLFVTQNNKDHDDHGPRFVEIMLSLNKKENLSISIYHNFVNEVAFYRTHWWKCSGTCGITVKRSMNRKPGPYDRWWKRHQLTCGGTFEKIQEPDGFQKKKRAQASKKSRASKSRRVESNTDNTSNQPRLLNWLKKK